MSQWPGLPSSRPQVALELAERREEGSSVPSVVLEHTSSLVDLHVGDGELHLGAQGVEVVDRLDRVDEGEEQVDHSLVRV